MQHGQVEDQRQNRFTNANKELDTFIYHLSHHLKAPLSSILGLTNLALNNAPKTTDDFITYFSMIRQSALSMEHKLSELLHYSKNALGEVNVEKIDLSKILHEAFNDMKYLPGHEFIEFHVSVNDDQPFFSDAYRISAILENLITNAIKYSDRNKEKSFIHIKAQIIPEQVLITFHDNGIGIADDQLDKVFNMFYRATGTSSGSGLGLYLVGEMMNTLKGNIEISSTFGKETHITLTIPNNPPRMEVSLNDHLDE